MRQIALFLIPVACMCAIIGCKIAPVEPVIIHKPVIIKNLANIEHDLVEINRGSATLHVDVSDNRTGEPIKNALVFLGDGNGPCSTSAKGKCELRDFPRGSRYMNVFKKGYFRSMNDEEFQDGENFRIIKLIKRFKEPRSISIEGTIFEVVTAKGTKSENRLYKIKHEDRQYYIFNEIGFQGIGGKNGFPGLVGKTVIVNGFFEIGFVGWKRAKVEGIYMEEIRLVQDQASGPSGL
ncbi:hypothetical protein ACFL6Y_05205 [Elusimicrobiota bacterium]